GSSGRRRPGPAAPGIRPSSPSGTAWRRPAPRPWVVPGRPSLRWRNDRAWDFSVARCRTTAPARLILLRYVIAYTASRYPEVGSEIETGDVRRRRLAPFRCARRRLDPGRDGDRPRVAVGCGGRHPGR